MNQQHSNLPNGFIKALQKSFAHNSFSIDPSDCWPYGYDYSQRHYCPSAICFPSKAEDVINVMKLCNEFKVPIIGRGGATNATGAVVPIGPSIILSFERMDKILQVSPEDRYLCTQVGALNSQVQNAAQEVGFFWGPCPTSSDYSTIGGNLACNASGARALKYGSCRENTLGLTAVTGSGKLIHTGVKTTKTSVGYDLTRLLIGSEGTLALIVNATLKLTPSPNTIYTSAITYKSIEDATSAVSKIMSQPVVPYSLEFMDAGCLSIIRDLNPELIPKNAKAMLIVEIDANAKEIELAQASIIDAASCNILSINHAINNNDRAAIWHLRKSLPAALRKLAPKKLNEDIVVPISKIPQFIKYTEELSEKFKLPIVNFGHAGNGNIHTNILYDPQNNRENEQVEQALSCLFDLVISLGGSLSGEHGIGLEKQPFINKELDQNSIEIMSKIKQSFDPNNILNPGKIFKPTCQDVAQGPAVQSCEFD
ncbi:MAG: FAD-binding protein [Francisellaceae bacterium]|jgi:D-lactate dehydrogenase (quinone)|nr:FAD-binding protein [Francisellaceae bacterium]MBT6206463.1 FAD-binding protein [Francisellaceae bacterium]MBT6537896.1 FAD-binding protein [Francisellaceae bacterium]